MNMDKYLIYLDRCVSPIYMELLEYVFLMLMACISIISFLYNEI